MSALARFVLALVVAMGAAWSPNAQAHTRSESHSAWTIEKRIVRADVSFADVEAARIDPKGARPSEAALLAYLTPRVDVLAGDLSCPLATKPRAVLAATGFRRFEFVFDCPGTADMKLRYAGFFDIIGTHFNLAQVQFSQGEFVEQLFTSDSQTLDLKKIEGGSLGNAGFFDFIGMGIMHIVTGVDHMSFLLGLVLISRRLRDLVFVVTGFTIGHSLTLGLAVTGLIRPHAEFIDALVALTIALIGIENIVATLNRPNKVAIATGAFLLVMAAMSLLGIGLLPPLLLLGAALFSGCYLLVSGHLNETGRLRMVVTTVFGLIHGFGFAADLLESRLPAEKLAEILVGFNLGVELAQLTFVLTITGLVHVVRRTKLALPRPITADVLASSLVGLGMFWFIGRSY